MIKVTVKARVYYEKKTENNLVYNTEVEVGCKKDLENLSETVIKVTELDSELIEDIPGSYVAVIGDRDYRFILNEASDRVQLELIAI